MKRNMATGKAPEKGSLELPICPALKQEEEENELVLVKVEKSSQISPAVSRYGRTHKPKISEDFLPTDKKVGAILGLSPKKRLTLPRHSSPSPQKVEKGSMISEILQNVRRTSRGRKPKLKLSNSSLLDNSFQGSKTSCSPKITDEIKSEVSTSEKTKDLNTEIKVERSESTETRKIENEKDNEIMSPDVTSSVDDTILSESIVSQSSTSNNKVIDCGWCPGDLAWARVGGHPFWPCMVAVDPRSGVYTKIKRVGRGLSSVQRSLHVQFFGDNGRHSWVSTNCVIKFEGKDGLQDFADKVLSEIKKKDKKYSSAFVIRQSSKLQWDCAVNEAEEAIPKTNQERIRFFEETFPTEKFNDELDKMGSHGEDEEERIKSSRTLKRKRSIDLNEQPQKQVKVDPESNTIIIKEEKDVDNIVNVPTRRRQRRRKRVKKEPYDFRVFADKYSKHASEIHPGLSEESLQKLMVRMWSAMDESEKSVYKRERRVSSEESSAEDEVAIMNENDNDNSSDSTRESTPSLTYSRTPLKKAGSLFRGTRLEKVCQICLIPGNTVKCKGSCLGVFHLECIKSPPKVKKEIVETEVKKKRGRPKIVKNENESVSEHCEIQVNNNSNGILDGKTQNISDEKDANDEEEDKMKHSGEEYENGEFRCKECSENHIPPCFVCSAEKDPKTGSHIRIRCANGHCGKFYHLECVKTWPQASCIGSSKKQTNGSKNTIAPDGTKIQVLTCPQHVCHTCASDDPRNATMRFNHERLVRCIMCPTAYHTGNYCVPAGTEILTGSQIICPRHYEPPAKGNHHVNAAWCFICAVGGSLICCDLCPTSFHAECLRIAPPEEGYICEDCDTGRYPLYGEVAWVKLGAYRWWPAQILFPNQIPDNIENLPHKRGEFAVRFFGSHDHYWVNRGRVFLYQEGDSGHKSAKKTSVDGLFQKALAEAAEAHKAIKVERSLREAEARPGMKPPSYVRIKTNKPVGNVRVYEVDPSSMTPCECDPDSKNPCGVDSDCLNRILMVECTPGVCAAGDRCGNQCFLKREYPPLEPFRTESRGWGLRALKSLRKGEFVIEYVGEMIDEGEYRRRLDCKHQEKDENYYFLTIDNHRMLDAGPKGNVARFMNHSCQPNCETQKWTVNGDTRVGLFALQDIPKGEELTFNYNLECVGPDKKPCMCGAANCSGYIGVKVSKLVEDDKKTKLGKQDQQRVTKRKKKRQSTKLTEGECFECGGGGELLLCDNKTCPKGYHLNCAKRKTWPTGKWLCPWHLCDICQRRTGKRCGFCPRSFCIQHAEGNIRLNSSMGMVCQKHDEDADKQYSDAYNEILEDVAICLKGLDRSNDVDNKETLEKGLFMIKSDDSQLSLEETSDTTTNVETSTNQAELFSEKKSTPNSSATSEPSMSKSPFQASTPVQNSSSSVLTSVIVPPKKRGRPRKNPFSPPATPQNSAVKSLVANEIKTPDFAPVLINTSTVKKKRGRPRKYPLVDASANTSTLSSTSPTATPLISPSAVPAPTLPPPSSSLSATPPLLQTQSPLPDTLLYPIFQEKSVIIKESGEKSGKIENNVVANNLPDISPRTSSRKRQPSAKLAAYMNSKSVKKRMKKSLDGHVLNSENSNMVDKEKNKMGKTQKSPDIVINKNDGDCVKTPATTLNKNSTNTNNKSPVSRLNKKYITKIYKTSDNKVSKNYIGKSDKSNLNKHRKVHVTKTNKAYVSKSEKSHLLKSEKVRGTKVNSSLINNLDKNNVTKSNKNFVPLKAEKDFQPLFKPYQKKTPKKTILQRVDHKPDVSRFSVDCNRKLLHGSSSDSPSSSKGSVYSNILGSSNKTPNNIVSSGESEVLYQKTGINGMSEISANSSILESFDDSESQYFSESVTTIPIKFSEFEQTNDEFLVGSGSPTEELVETRSNLDAEFTPVPSEETTEKLSADGKYQILTNMRPDSLDIEKQNSVLMEVGS